MQVCAADRAAVDADAHFARPRLGIGNIAQPQRRGLDRSDLVENHRFHGDLSRSGIEKTGSRHFHPACRASRSE
jgi:hypothetical protein